MTFEPLLEALKRRTRVSCDTFDVSVPRSYSSMHDATSNQIIINVLLQRSENKHILVDALKAAQNLDISSYGVHPDQVIIEIAVRVQELGILDRSLY